MRRSMKKMKNNEPPLSQDCQRITSDVSKTFGFDFKTKKPSAFEERLEELEAYKAKHGHCDVETKTGDEKPLGNWCSQVRLSMKNNDMPVVTGLSADNIRRLENIGFFC